MLRKYSFSIFTNQENTDRLKMKVPFKHRMKSTIKAQQR